MLSMILNRYFQYRGVGTSSHEKAILSEHSVKESIQNSGIDVSENKNYWDSLMNHEIFMHSTLHVFFVRMKAFQ